MSKSGWKRRLMAGLLCMTLVFQNLSISASAAAGDADGAVETQETDTAQETEEIQEAEEIQEEPQESVPAQEEEAQEMETMPAEPEVEQELVLASEEEEEPPVVEDPDQSTVKMIEDGSISTGTREIKDVDRNNAKWITFNPGKVGDYYIYTTNDGTNTNGDPMVAIFSEKRESIKKNANGTINLSGADYGDNNAGHAYKNFYAELTVTDKDAQYFIFAGSESSKTDAQTAYTLHVERKEPISGGDSLEMPADKTVAVTDVSEYHYRWLVFKAPADGIYKFETAGDHKSDGNVEVYEEKKEEAELLANKSECVTIPAGKSVYIRAFASDSSWVEGRLPYDTVNFEVQAVTVAKTDSFTLKFSDIKAKKVSYQVNYTGTINFAKSYTIEYKKRGDEEDNTITVNGNSGSGELPDLDPGTTYDVKLRIKTNKCVNTGTEEEPKDAEIIITGSFTTKTEKPAEYNQPPVDLGDYKLYAAIEEITGGFKVTGLKVTKKVNSSVAEENQSVRISISYKEAAAADTAYQPIGYPKTVTLGEDITVVGWSIDGLYLGNKYLLKIDLQETGATAQESREIDLKAGEWPSGLNLITKQGYQTLAFDFSQTAVKPTAITVRLADGDEVKKTLINKGNYGNVYAYGLTESDIKDMTAPKLILEVWDKDDHRGLKKLDTVLNVLEQDKINITIDKTEYDEDNSGMKVSVTISAAAEAIPNLTAKAGFRVDGTTKSSKTVPVGKDGKVELVIPELNAGAEGSLTVTLYEDKYQGLNPVSPNYGVLKAYTPKKTDEDGTEQDKTYTVGESALYEVTFDVKQVAIDNASYTIGVSKLQLGGSVSADIEYASETKAEEDSGTAAVDAATNLEDGKGLKKGDRHRFYFDEGKDPAMQMGELTGLEPDYNYAYRVKLYNTRGTLLRTSTIKTFKTKSVSELTISQSVEETENKYKEVRLKAKFNITVDAENINSNVRVKYRELVDGETPLAWEDAKTVTGWKIDDIDKTLMYVDLDITKFKAGAEYEWLVIEYKGESVQGRVISDTRNHKFKVPVPALTTTQKPGSYDVKLTLSSEDIKDYLDATGNRLILYYTDDNTLDPSALTAEEHSKADYMEKVTIEANDFSKNVYTQKQEAEIDLGNLKASTGYSYAIYIDDGNYLCLKKDGRFMTKAPVSDSDFSVVNTDKSDGYNQIQLTFSYAKAPDGIDIEEAALKKGVIVRAKKSDGREQPEYTPIEKDIELTTTGSRPGISIDPVNHTISLTVNYNNLKSWLGETSTEFHLLSERSIQPYITVKGGEDGSQELTIKATEVRIEYKALSADRVEVTSVQSVNTISNGVELTIKGNLSPVYPTDGTLYAFAEYRAIVDGAPTEPTATARVEVDKRTGSFTITQADLDYVSEYMVNLYVATEDKTVWKYDNGTRQSVDTSKYANCSGAKSISTVKTQEDFVLSMPNNIRSTQAEILVWTRKGSAANYAVAVASKESNPALFKSDTQEDFDQAVIRYNKLTTRWSSSYGIDASNDAFLSGVDVAGLTADTDYVYAVALRVDGQYKWLAGGEFKTSKYDDSTLFDDWGYHFYKREVTDTTAAFSATLAPKYISYKNYKVEITYYKKDDAGNKKTSGPQTYTTPGQEFTLTGLTPATEYIVEKVEILDKDNNILDTYTSEELNFTTLAKPLEGTFMEGSGELEMIEGTLRTDGFKVKAGFTYEDHKALSPFQICVYEGETPTYTVRDISIGNPVEKYAEAVDDEGNKFYKKIYQYTIDNAAEFKGLKPNTTYTVRAELLTNDRIKVAETTITTLADIEYDLSGDAVIKDASLRKHIVDVLEGKIVFPDLKLKRSEIEAANITTFTVNDESISRETPPVKTLEGLEILGQLTSLTISHQDVENADAVGKLVNLKELNLSFNCLTSVPDLRNCKELKSLNISANMIAEAAFDSVESSDENGKVITYYRNINISHVHDVTFDKQRGQSYALVADAFDTIKDIDPKLEASVLGYRTDRKYKAVVTIGTSFSETIYIEKLSDSEDPDESKFHDLVGKQAALPVGVQTMKVIVTSEEEYNFGSEIANIEAAFTVNAPVAFTDAALEAAVKELCIKENKAVADITELKLVKNIANGTAITSLEGIKVLRRLETLVIRGHALTDAGPVAELEHVKKVDLSHNAIVTVPDFALKELYYLDLSYNALTAIPNLERCSAMIEDDGTTRVLDYRWNFISGAAEVFTRTNYRIPEYFRYLNGWLAKQARCQRVEGENSDLLLEITDSTFAAIGGKVNSRIVVNGLEYGNHNTFKMVIKENGKEVGNATGVYVPEDNSNDDDEKEETKKYPCHYFKFTDLKLSNGEHTLTFEITSPSLMPNGNANNYGTIGEVEATVTVRRNVIEDRALRNCLTEETAEITDIYDKENAARQDKGNLAIDEIKEFTYTGQAFVGTKGREPVRSLKGISYMTALEKFDLAGNELENPEQDEWFSELEKLSGIAPDPKAEKDAPAKVNLSYNNLTNAPEGVDVNVSYNLIDTDVELAGTQRKYQLTKENIYYRVSDQNTAPIYIEAKGLKITSDNTEYRTYRFELTEGDKVIAAIDRDTGDDPNQGYRKIKESSKLGIYVADTKLANGEHTLKLTATDDLGQTVDYGTFTVKIADPITWARLNTVTAVGDRLPTTDDEIQVMLSAPYLNESEQFKSLTLTLTPENAAEVPIGTYSNDGSPAVLTGATVVEQLYNSTLFKNMPTSMSRVNKVQFSGTVNIKTPLEEAFYTVAVETTANRTLKAEKVRFGLDGRRLISGVTLSEAYDSTGDYIYIKVEGSGLDFNKLVPVLYSRKNVELTGTATAGRVEVQQVSGNNFGWVVYKLAKLHKPIWDDEDESDALFTEYDSNNDGTKDAEGIYYKILYDEDDYELQPDFASETSGYITGYKQKEQSISKTGFVIYNAAFNYVTGQLEVVFGEKASSDEVTLTGLTPQSGNATPINNWTSVSTVVKNGIAYFDLTSYVIEDGTYRAAFTNEYDNKATSKAGTYDVTFPQRYKGPNSRNTLTTYGSITTYEIKQDAEDEETQFFAEGTTKIGFRVFLHSDVYNHLEPYRLHLAGTGNANSVNITADKYFYLSAPDENGNMTATGIIETDSPLTVGGNTNDTNNSYKITLQHRDAGTDKTYKDVNLLYTDINGNKNQQTTLGTPTTPIAREIFVYAPHVKTGKVLASAISLDDEKKTLTITTNNADELDTSGFSVRLTYLDKSTEDKAVSGVTRHVSHDNRLILDLSNILADDACWIDALYGSEKTRMYYQYTPEKLYGEAPDVDNNGHDAYYHIHERLRFLSVKDYGYYYGCEGTEGGLTIRIADVTDTKVYKELTSAAALYEFTSKDLKGLDLTKVYCLTAKDRSGNTLTVTGNIAPKEGKVPKSIKLDKTAVKLNSATNDTVQLTATVSGGDKEIVWRSTDTRIATVDQNGLVRAVSSAAELVPPADSETVMIEAVSRYGDGSIKAECEVEVHKFSVRTISTANGIVTDPDDTVELDTDLEKQPTLELRATWDNDADAKFVKYTTTDTSVINVKDGIVTPVGVGSAVIKAERDGYTAYCNVTVTLPVKGAVITYDIDGFGTYREVESVTLVNGHGTDAEYRLDWKPSPASAAKTAGYKAYFKSSRPDLVAVEEYETDKWHLVPIAPTGGEEVVITLTVAKTDEAVGNLQNRTIVATDTLKVTVVGNLMYPEKICPDVPETVTVYTDIAPAKKGLTLGDVKLPDGWKWTDDTSIKLYEGTITAFDAVYELEGYAPETRKREDRNPINVWVGKAQEPQINYERYGRDIITRTSDTNKSGLALNVSAGNISADSRAVLDAKTLHYTLAATNEYGLDITYDTPADERDNPLWFYVEAGSAPTGSQTVTVSATYECEWIYKEATEEHPKYEAWNNSVVLTTQQTYKVVEGSVVDTVRLERTNQAGKIEQINISATEKLAADAEYTYTLTAYDQWGVKIKDAQFTWNCEDREVLSVSGSEMTASVRTNKGGKTKLTFTANDDGAYTRDMTVWVLNAEPHIEGTKATVNTAVDYENYPKMGETISIIPAYEESLVGTPVITTGNGENAAVSPKFELWFADEGKSGRQNRELAYVVPKKGVTLSKSDGGNYYIRTATDAGYYFSPLKITVTTKKPSVSISQSDKVNLFYKHDTGIIKVLVKGITGEDEGLDIKWSKTPQKGQAGFVLGYDEDKDESPEIRYVKNGVEYDIPVKQQVIELNAKNKLADMSILKGELAIKIPGYKETIKKTITIGTIYKAPVYTIYGIQDLYKFDLTKYTVKGKVVMSPEVGWSQGRTIVRVAAADQVEIKDQLMQSATLAWKSKTTNINEPRGTQLERVICYDYITWTNKNIDVKVFNRAGDATDYLHIITTSNKGLSDTLEFHSSEWRGTVKTKLSLQMVKPTIALEKSTITVNKNYTDESYNYANNNYRTKLTLKNFVNGIGAAGISIKGDKKSQPLLDSGILQVTCNTTPKPTPPTTDLTAGGVVEVKLSDDEALKKTLKNGSYKFTLTPYIEPGGNRDQGLKTFKSTTLTVKVVDKEVQAKASIKGKLDLLKVYGYDHNDEIDETNTYKNEFKNLIKGSYVELNTKFTNIDIEDDKIAGVPKLIGEYADQFTIECLTEHTSTRDIDHYIIRRSDRSYENYEETDQASKGGKLFAKESYKLQVVYTLQSGIEITSNVITIKPIQSVPKITMDIKNAELYASSTGERNGIMFSITVPEGYGYNYKNSILNGNDENDLFDRLGIRCGDIGDVLNYAVYDREAIYDKTTGATTLWYKFNIEDGRGEFVKTTNKGVTSKFAFTYELYGRDRKSKDAFNTIKLTVKR